MAIRVCRRGHITGYRKCSLCEAKADELLAGRRQPETMHPRSAQLVALRYQRHLTGFGGQGFVRPTGVLAPADVPRRGL